MWIFSLGHIISAYIKTDFDTFVVSNRKNPGASSIEVC